MRQGSGTDRLGDAKDARHACRAHGGDAGVRKTPVGKKPCDHQRRQTGRPYVQAQQAETCHKGADNGQLLWRAAREGHRRPPRTVR